MSSLTNYHAGLSAEAAVSRCYEEAGYRIVCSRFRGAAGEIDVIAKRGADVVFIEVKKSETHARAAARVTPRQIKRLFATASEFLAHEPNGQDTGARFDVALVDAAGRVDILENVLAA